MLREINECFCSYSCQCLSASQKLRETWWHCLNHVLRLMMYSTWSRPICFYITDASVFAWWLTEIDRLFCFSNPQLVSRASKLSTTLNRRILENWDSGREKSSTSSARSMTTGTRDLFVVRSAYFRSPTSKWSLICQDKTTTLFAFQ